MLHGEIKTSMCLAERPARHKSQMAARPALRIRLGERSETGAASINSMPCAPVNAWTMARTVLAVPDTPRWRIAQLRATRMDPWSVGSALSNSEPEKGSAGVGTQDPLFEAGL